MKLSILLLVQKRRLSIHKGRFKGIHRKFIDGIKQIYFFGTNSRGK